MNIEMAGDGGCAAGGSYGASSQAMLSLLQTGSSAGAEVFSISFLAKEKSATGKPDAWK